MKLKTVVVGLLEENCYILEDNNKCIIIDPGAEFEKIKSNIECDVVGILITHYHDDHIGALEDFKKMYKLNENDYNIDGFNFEVISTPGHTSDSKTYYFKDYNIMFTGDFLFHNSIGRMDLPTGSVGDMKKSLEKIFKYPLDTIIYPGHGDKSTLKNEIDIYY